MFIPSTYSGVTGAEGIVRADWSPAPAFPKDDLRTRAFLSVITLVPADAETWVGPRLAQGWLCSPLLSVYSQLGHHSALRCCLRITNNQNALSAWKPITPAEEVFEIHKQRRFC